MNANSAAEFGNKVQFIITIKGIYIAQVRKGCRVPSGRRDLERGSGQTHDDSLNRAIIASRGRGRGWSTAAAESQSTAALFRHVNFGRK